MTQVNVFLTVLQTKKLINNKEQTVTETIKYDSIMVKESQPTYWVLLLSAHGGLT